MSDHLGSDLQSQRTRIRAATFALGTTILLTALKVGAGIATGSVGVISEGIHSGLDLVSAAIAFFTIREAGKPADADHPFGHGKIETLSSLSESILLLVAAGFIVNEGVDRLYHPQPMENGGIAVAAIVISLLVSFFVYKHNRRAAESTDSSAIRVNALHFLADTVTATGVLGALVAIQLTGWTWIDPLVAFAIAIYIIIVSWGQVRAAIADLTDKQLPEEELTRLQGIVDSFDGKIIEAHDLKTRRSGANRHIEFHLSVCGKMSVQESHAICDEIEAAIEREFPRTLSTIHVEPCNHHEPNLCVPCERCAGGWCEYMRTPSEEEKKRVERRSRARFS